MSTPKVSVVIPVYNTEKYIEDTLHSILNQTLKDLEIVVVNDGSTDNSLAVVEKVAQADSRVRVFSQANGGVSRARNTGVEQIRGEFVYYIDSDDLLEPEALQQCYDKCVRHELDFVFFDAESFVDGGNHLKKLDYSRLAKQENEVSKGSDVLLYLVKNNIFKTPVWLNFIRVSYLKSLGLTFYPGIIHEDELYSFKLYLNAARVGYIPQVFSRRRIRQDSIMTHKFSWKNMIGYFTVTSELLEYRKSLSEEYKALLDLFLTKTLNAVLWIAHAMSFSDKLHILTECIKRRCMKYITFRSWMILFFKRKK